MNYLTLNNNAQSNESLVKIVYNMYTKPYIYIYNIVPIKLTILVARLYGFASHSSNCLT